MRKALLGLVSGICLFAISAPAALNLVQNGGFETGDFSSWYQFGNTGFTSVTGPTATAPEGLYYASFGAVGSPGGIGQILGVTPGVSYNISFLLRNRSSGTPNELTITFDTVTLWHAVNLPSSDWTAYTFTAVAGSPQISFEFRHDPSWFDLDAVSVTVVPEPTTMVAGALLLLPFAASTIRRFRRS